MNHQAKDLKFIRTKPAKKKSNISMTHRKPTQEITEIKENLRSQKNAWKTGK